MGRHESMVTILAGSRLKMLEGAPMANDASAALMPRIASTCFMLSMLEFDENGNDWL